MTSALSNMSNLGQRVIVALIGVAILITCIVLNEWAYLIVFGIICLLSMLEFYKLTGLDGLLPLKSWGTFTGLLLYLLSFLVEHGDLSSKYYFIVLPIATSIFFIKLYKKSDERPFTNIAYTFLGVLYVALQFAFLNMIAFTDGVYNYQIIMGILLLLWASDSGAYFAGTRFGKTKLFERVSPKKSWEGFVGGLILNLGVAWALSHYFPFFPLWKWVVIGVIVSVAGTYGDLVESLFKRGIEIKDSGKTLPGHGGFLDRFDGLLLSVPFIVAFIELTK